MVLRQADVQVQVEKFWLYPPSSRLYKTETNYQGNYCGQSTPEDPKWKYICHATLYCGKNQTLSMVRFSTIKNYLLPHLVFTSGPYAI
jgi:hypothetical protein